MSKAALKKLKRQERLQNHQGLTKYIFNGKEVWGRITSSAITKKGGIPTQILAGLKERRVGKAAMVLRAKAKVRAELAMQPQTRYRKYP